MVKEEPLLVILHSIFGPMCTSAKAGQWLHDEIIAPMLRERRRVLLSFKNVETVIPTFLNAAIGQLYGEFSEERIRELLSVEDIAQDDLNDLKRVVENAIKYFAVLKSDIGEFL